MPCLLLVPSVRSAVNPQGAMPSHLRVKIFHDARASRADLQVNEGALLVRSADGAGEVLRLEPGTAYRLRVDGGQACVESDALRRCAAHLQLAPTTDAAAFTLAVQNLPAGSPVRRRYRGALSVRADAQRSGTLRLVHMVERELYVAGVVQREYGMGDVEGSKAMAVLARTYALRQRGRVADYDLVDTIEHQVYFGVEGIRDAARQAAEETRGEVLTHQGRLAEAVYSASSGGYTASNQDVWNSTPVAYLRAQPDPYDARLSPHRSWTSRLDATAFLAALSRSYGPDVVGFRVSSRTDDGRAQLVTLALASGQRRQVTATQFRRVANGLGGAMTLRSFKFDARLEGAQAVFNGSGFGHGVGLSQWGARAQALEGRSYRQILGFYYPGTAVRTLEGVAEPTPATPSLDVFLAGATDAPEARPAAPEHAAPAARPEAVAQAGRPSRNASTHVRLPAPGARPSAPAAPAPAEATAPASARRATIVLADATAPPTQRPAARPVEDGAYRRDPLGVRSAPPLVHPEASAPAARPETEAPPSDEEDRATRTIVTWGGPAPSAMPRPATPAPVRRVGW